MDIFELLYRFWKRIFEILIIHSIIYFLVSGCKSKVCLQTADSTNDFQVIWSCHLSDKDILFEIFIILWRLCFVYTILVFHFWDWKLLLRFRDTAGCQKKHQILLYLKDFGPSREQKLPESNLRSAIINKALKILIVRGRPLGERNELPCCFFISKICICNDIFIWETSLYVIHGTLVLNSGAKITILAYL